MSPTLPSMLFPMIAPILSTTIVPFIPIQTIGVLVVSIAVFTLLVYRPVREGKASKAIIGALLSVSVFNLVLNLWGIVMPLTSTSSRVIRYLLMVVRMALVNWPVIIASLFFIVSISVVILPTRWKHLRKDDDGMTKFFGIAFLVEVCLILLPWLIFFSTAILQSLPLLLK